MLEGVLDVQKWKKMSRNLLICLVLPVVNGKDLEYKVLGKLTGAPYLVRLARLRSLNLDFENRAWRQQQRVAVLWWSYLARISADLAKKWGKKCSTGQRFICTEVTSYKIHTLEAILRSIWKECCEKTPSVIVCFPRKSSTTIFYLYFPRLFELIQFRKGLFFWCLFRAQHSLQIPVIFHRTQTAQCLNLVAASLRNGNQSNPKDQLISKYLFCVFWYPKENFESMNLLQMSCVITWAQEKSASDLKKKKEWGRILVFVLSIFFNWDFNLEISQFSCQPQKCKL